jgi:hypothetical protein
MPGAMEFTRIPFAANSLAIPRISILMPLLVTL